MSGERPGLRLPKRSSCSGSRSVYAANITQPGAKAGTVLEQVPAAGSKVALGDTTIHLTIAASGPSSVRFVPHRSG